MNINRFKGQVKSYGYKMKLVLGKKPSAIDWVKYRVGCN